MHPSSCMCVFVREKVQSSGERDARLYTISLFFCKRTILTLSLSPSLFPCLPLLHFLSLSHFLYLSLCLSALLIKDKSCRWHRR